jgi:transcriptional regulator with XRE-family HTH domain
MDTRTEIREFLTSRRAKITPDQVGLPIYADNRRVPGLRREQVAMLAGVSVDYYTRLERGNTNGVSDTVLDALARALQLDEAERSHLFDLARAAQPTTASRPRRPTKQRIRPGVQRILDAITQAPAFIRNGRLDLLAANQLGHALYSTYLTPDHPANTARFVFLDPRSEEFYDDWDHIANEVVAILRSEAGRNPHDRDLTTLIGELSTQNETFRTKSAAHNVRFHDTGTKRLHHPVVGDLELTYEAIDLSADTGLTMFAHTAEPGSKSDQALQLLGSWAATPTQPDLTRTTDQA